MYYYAFFHMFELIGINASLHQHLIGSPTLKSIGLPVVALSAMQPVVFQVEAMGEYDSIQWSAPISGSGVLVDFNQTFVWFNQLECGVYFYKVDLVVNNSRTQAVNFTVATCSKY